MRTHAFTQKTEEMSANAVSKKNHDYCVLRRSGGVIFVDFLERGQTINSERYCETLRKLRRAIQNKCRGKLGEKVLFLRQCSSTHSQSYPRPLGWFWMESFQSFAIQPGFGVQRLPPVPNDEEVVRYAKYWYWHWTACWWYSKRQTSTEKVLKSLYHIMINTLI